MTERKLTLAAILRGQTVKEAETTPFYELFSRRAAACGRVLARQAVKGECGERPGSPCAVLRPAPRLGESHNVS